MSHAAHTNAPAALSAQDQQHFRGLHASSSSLKHPLIQARGVFEQLEVTSSGKWSDGTWKVFPMWRARHVAIDHISKIFPTLSLFTDTTFLFPPADPQKHFLGTSTSFSLSFGYYFALLPSGRSWANLHSDCSLQELTACSRESYFLMPCLQLILRGKVQRFNTWHAITREDAWLAPYQHARRSLFSV